jgi:beta-lactamase regulating signal transducer with metallopeptidase domain
MNAWAVTVPALSPVAHFLAVLLATALKGSLVFAAVYGASRLLRKGDPRLRHLLWLAVVVSYPLILLLSLFDLPLLPAAIGPPLSAEGLYGSLSAVLLPQPDGSSAAGSGAVPAASVRGFPWSILALLVWAVGVLLSLSRIAVGLLWVHRLRAEAAGARQSPQPHRRARAVRCAGHLGEIAGELAVAAGVARPVRVLESRRCQVPFAAGALPPLVVLPRAPRRWPAERLRAVLLHELQHVQRWDPQTQMAAFAACSLFWFVPPIWVAYSLLYTEQEKACDSGVVQNGVAPRRYAVCLLDVARLCREPAAFSSLYSPKGRHRILAERIRDILSGALNRGKGRRVFAAAAAVVCLMVLAGAAGFRPPPWNEALFQRFVGRWANQRGGGTYTAPDLTVIRPDHIGEDWLLPGSVAADMCSRWTIEVKGLWTDAEGNTWCRFLSTPLQGAYPVTMANLMRVDPRGEICEMNCTPVGAGRTARYPEAIDPLWTKYWVYTREQEVRP